MEWDVTPEEFKKELDSGKNVTLLDVRELEEIQLASIGGTHIPLGDLPVRFQELDPEKEIVVLCHHGVRSAHAVGFLRSQGFANVRNLRGGIDAWSLTVDPSVMRY